MHYIIFQGQVVGQLDEGVDFTPPSDAYELVDAQDYKAPPCPDRKGLLSMGRSRLDLSAIPKAPVPATFVGTYLFNVAATRAREDLAVNTEFSIALFAENQGNQELLKRAIANLEDILGDEAHPKAEGAVELPTGAFSEE